MATMVSIEEYLRTNYRPDVEYLSGTLKSKPEAGFEHGRTEVMLGAWFSEHEEEWEIRCALNTRTQVSPDCVRLVDVVVVGRGNREWEQLTVPPLVAIEVLSPTDTYKDLKARASDLAAMGVRNIWLIDPEARTGEVWNGSTWQLSQTSQLQAVDSSIFFDLAWLWEQMDE